MVVSSVTGKTFKISTWAELLLGFYGNRQILSYFSHICQNVKHFRQWKSSWEYLTKQKVDQQTGKKGLMADVMSWVIEIICSVDVCDVKSLWPLHSEKRKCDSRCISTAEAWCLNEIWTARLWFYLEGRERTVGSYNLLGRFYTVNCLFLFWKLENIFCKHLS